MSIHEDSDLDLSTPEKAAKAIADVTRAARQQRDENNKLTGQVDAMVRDLKAASQRLTELQNIVQTGTAGAGDGEFSRFVEKDKVLLRGGVAADDGWRDGLLDAQEPVNAWHGDLLRAVEDYNLVKLCLRSGPEPVRGVRSRLNAVVKAAPPAVKRAFADSAAVGAEWIPDVMLPQLEMEFKLARRVASLFGTMPMSNKNLLLPFLTTGLRPYKKGTVTTDDPAQYASSSLETAQRTIDAVGFAVRTQVDEEAVEDAIFDALPILRAELISAIVDGEEDCLINGDTAATHQDTALATWNIRSRWGSSGLGGSSDHRRAWIGLRARAKDVSCETDQNAAQTTAGFVTARGKLDSPHGVGGDLVCITSPEYYLIKMTSFSEVLTMDKIGSMATILSGQLGSLMGVPIVLSEFVDKAYATTGLYTSASTTTGFLLVNRSRFKIGERRGSAIEVEKDITRGIFNMVATRREIFFTVDSSTKKNVHWSYNLSAS